MQKETYQREKRPIYGKRNNTTLSPALGPPHISKEIDLYEKTPVYMKSDISVWTETYPYARDLSKQNRRRKETQTDSLACCCNTLQHTATHCNHTAKTHCNTLQYTATLWQPSATHVLQHYSGTQHCCHHHARPISCSTSCYNHVPPSNCCCNASG
jgi:hypothetical protein